MNLASAGRPRIPLYGNGRSATSKVTFSVLKFSSLPNVTGNVIFPFGLLLPGLIPWNVPVSSSSLSGTWSFRSTAEEIRFKPAPPSTSILVTLRLRIVGETNIDKHPTAVVRSGWSSISKMIGVLDHFRSLRDSTGGSVALTSRTHCLSWRCEVCREAPPSTQRPLWLFGTPAHWFHHHPCLRRCHLHPCRGRGEVCLLAAAWPCRGVLPGRCASRRILQHLLGLSPCRVARIRPFAARQAARPSCSSGGHGPWCGGSCSTVCWCRPACRRPPQPGSWRMRQPPCWSYQPWLSWRHLHCRTAQQLAHLCLSSSCCSAAGFSLPGQHPRCQILLLLYSLRGVSSLPQHVHTCRPGHTAH